MPCPKNLVLKPFLVEPMCQKNIQNNDKKCFLWSTLASLHPVQLRNHPTRVSKYQEYEHELNMSGNRVPRTHKGNW